MSDLPRIPNPPRNANGSLREDTTALGWLWDTLVQTLTSTLPAWLRRLANDVDIHR